MTTKTILTIFLFIFFKTITAKDEEVINKLSSQSVPCYTASTCSECISNLNNCSWCSDVNYNDEIYSRCESSDKILINNKCNYNYIINPVGQISLINDEARDEEAGPVNLSPKKVKLDLRPGQPLRFNITIKQEENYPVDLYYLMDVTYSMKDHKDSLGQLGDQLSAEMKSITSNFRLGFGTFIDKIIMPFASMVPRKLINPCSDGVDCIAPYSFRNHLSLTDNYSEFTNQVNSAGLSGNLDNAEGGLDAIIQSIVCKDIIKWDQDAEAKDDENIDRDANTDAKQKSSQIRRKILLFATGSEFHFAGDGKLGGVIAKNDLKCHLDAEGYYDNALIQDYPSVYQVNKVIGSNKVNLIFAITPESVEIYEKLSKMIDGSTVGILSKDSSNIVSLIKKNYDKIVSKIELISNLINFNDEDVSINFYSRCKDGDTLVKTNECNNIKIGDTIQFEVEVAIHKCSPNSEKDEDKKRKIIKISPIGLNVETEIEINLICNCETCEVNQRSLTKEAPINFSKDCNFNGHLECGICSCAKGSFGKYCECQGSVSKSNDKLNECKRPLSVIDTYSNDTYGQGQGQGQGQGRGVVSLSQVECSNRGICNCGQCSCDTPSIEGERFYGKYCECDTFSCEKSKDQLCGGNGKCCDGQCQCNEGWSGSACDCPTDVSTCVAPNGLICSGHGYCHCGSCYCTEDNKKYFDANNLSSNESIKDVSTSSSLIYVGSFCEECLNCDGRCSDIEECIKCTFDEMFENYLDDDACVVSCMKLDIFIINYDNETNELIEQDSDEELMKKFKLINVISEEEREKLMNETKKCKLIDSNGCYIDFEYEFNYLTERANVYIDFDEKSCPKNELNLWIIIGSIVALIVIIGLILICTIRFLIYLKDRNDFLKWSQEVENSKKELNNQKTLNPLYKEANTKYNNPLYGN